MKTKKVPEWNADLAARVRDGMTLEALEAEIVSAIEGDSKNNRENARNDALAQALLDTTSINILPESLVEETTQMRFQTMLVDFKEQGSTQEQLEEMCVASLRLPPPPPPRAILAVRRMVPLASLAPLHHAMLALPTSLAHSLPPHVNLSPHVHVWGARATPEKYLKYKEISQPNVHKIVKLGMAFRDIAEKEKISVSPTEVRSRLTCDVVPRPGERAAGVCTECGGEKCPKGRGTVRHQPLRFPFFPSSSPLPLSPRAPSLRSASNWTCCRCRRSSGGSLCRTRRRPRMRSRTPCCAKRCVVVPPVRRVSAGKLHTTCMQLPWPPHARLATRPS